MDYKLYLLVYQLQELVISPPFNNKFYEVKTKIDSTVSDEINQRLSIHNIKLNDSEITIFNPNWILKKKDVGVSWIKNK